MPTSRYVRLTEEEDVRLREIEQAPYFKPKVRLRAQVLRLSHRGSNVRTISAYTGRAAGRASAATSTAGKSEASRASSMGRLRPTRRASPRRRGPSWEASSARNNAPGTPPSLPRLSQGASEWRSPPKPSADTSARWAIAGSAPAMCPANHHRTPTRSAKPEKSRRPSKKGSRRGGPPEVPGRERLLFVPAPELHLDAEGHGPPAPGEEPVGLRRTDRPHRHAVLIGRGSRAVGVLGDRGFVPQRRG